MATMLAFVVTDAAVETPELKRTLTRALQAAGVPAVEIGEVLARAKPLIRVTS